MTRLDDPNEPDISEQLRRLGYLQNPLEKFFVGKVSRRTSVLKTNIVVGLRVGVAGGVVLGALIATGAAILDSATLLHPITNYLVLAGLLSVAYVLIACTIGLLGAVVLTIVSSVRKKVIPRIRLASIRAGMLGAVVTFVYLTLQWQRLKPSAGESGFFSFANLGALAVNLVIAVLIGRMVSVAVLVILCRLRGVELKEHAHPARAYAAGGVLAAAVGVFFLVLFLTAERREAVRADDFVVEPTGTRVVVIGLDGATLEWFQKRRKSMPTLDRLATAGTFASLEKTGNPVPASVWTSIATGVPPETHKVRDVVESHVHGLTTVVRFDRGFAGFDEAINYILRFFRFSRDVPSSSASTNVKSIWNIAAENKRAVGVVNWWLSSPAESPKNGFVIGDGAYGSLLTSDGANGDVHPAELAKELKPLTDSPKTVQVSKALRKAYATDMSNRKYAMKALDELGGKPDLLALSFSGIDQLIYRLDEEQAEQSVRDEALARYSVLLDAEVERIVARFEKDKKKTIFVIVGDPGLPSRDGNERGFLIFSGGACNLQKALLKAATIYDIAPTVLYLLGMPRSEEMSGRILLETISDEFKRDHETWRRHTIKSYGRKGPTNRPIDPERQRQRLDDLRKNGYVK